MTYTPTPIRAIKDVCKSNKIPFIENHDPKGAYIRGYCATFSWKGIESNLLGKYDNIDHETIAELIKKLAHTINLVSVESEQLKDEYALWVAIHTDKGIYMCRLRGEW